MDLNRPTLKWWKGNTFLAFQLNPVCLVASQEDLVQMARLTVKVT